MDDIYHSYIYTIRNAGCQDPVHPRVKLVVFATRILVGKISQISCPPGYVLYFRQNNVGIYSLRRASRWFSRKFALSSSGVSSCLISHKDCLFAQLVYKRVGGGALAKGKLSGALTRIVAAQSLSQEVSSSRHHQSRTEDDELMGDATIHVGASSSCTSRPGGVPSRSG